MKNIFYQGAIKPVFIAQQLEAHQKKTNIGAHQLFLGQVRADKVENETVTGIEYSTYEELALKKMHEIREQLFDKYDLACMHVYHSLGRVNTGEICLFVFVSSAHRAAATQACAELVEHIKSDLPIWGKELTDNHYQWKENN